MTPDQIAELRKAKYNATVTRLTKVHSDLLVMRVQPDTSRSSRIAGQYTTLGLGYWEPRFPGCGEEELSAADEGKLARRSYSISCPMVGADGELLPRYDDWLEFYITLVRKTETGKAPVLTPRLFMLQQGDRLHLGEKVAGHYTLADVGPTDTVVFLGTGTGEAPHNYMLWNLLKRNHPGRILSACCVRYKKDLAYLATHERLMKRHPNYAYVPLATRETTEGKVYIQDLITSGKLEQRLGAPLNPASTHVFLCGNPKMIGVPDRDAVTGALSFPQPTGVLEILTGRGFRLDQPAKKQRGNVHYEEYW